MESSYVTINGLGPSFFAGSTTPGVPQNPDYYEDLHWNGTGGGALADRVMQCLTTGSRVFDGSR
jgi:hypothetical protein